MLLLLPNLLTERRSSVIGEDRGNLDAAGGTRSPGAFEVSYLGYPIVKSLKELEV